MTEYSENFIETYSGRKFHYLEPSPNEIHIEDIAHALSLKCRFSGHCRELYTVGEHSLWVALLLPPELQLSGLLHDATETYMPDIPRPIKEKFGLRKYEDTIARVIHAKYGTRKHPSIKEADNVILATEARDLMFDMDNWKKLPKPLEHHIVPTRNTNTVEHLFLACFARFGGIDA